MVVFNPKKIDIGLMVILNKARTAQHIQNHKTRKFVELTNPDNWYLVEVTGNMKKTKQARRQNRIET